MKRPTEFLGIREPEDLGCFFRELLLIVSSNLAMPDYTWIPSAFSDITHV